MKSRYLANPNVAAPYTGGKYTADALDNPFYPRLWEDRLYHDWSGKPKGIFVCDMSDLFGIGIPEEWTKKVLDRFQYCKQHRFYLLTKQPQNLIKFSPFPDNCWVGVTATNPEQLWLALEHFKEIKASIKYISFEPLLDSMFRDDWFPAKYTMKSLVDWVIIGSQTKPYKPPKIEWVQEISLACTKAHIPLFLKDNLKLLLPNRMPFWGGVHWTEMDKGVPIRMSENRYRQEMPIKT